ncbi:DUF1285 domain-containing protein [Pseudidiomarina sediminum]|uniref:DUF1285 domain-containing protein n=1 Tax=Pseudidiomarina sediminum TaxID=431675 RepID=A0A432YZD0_9GAMM|nr:DUF1285 domain-containing protein [Pseudidiomarina sediminum]MBY6064972.1 DUF1285 domain-containing protein [Pseudidiomarina sediminum]RUO68974.1 DUF1285 domain-containing protein [Pseudidiomarina sediminum]
MDLKQLLHSLELHQHAPTEQWNPPYCGEIPLTITADGQWHYQGSPITRPALVKLFASVLVREDADYYLITPAEKVKITVVDAPLLITAWRALESADGAVLQVTTNVDSQYPLSARYPLLVENDVPYVVLDHGLTAKVHRNVYYQWVELAEHDPATGEVFLVSAGHRFVLGQS